MHTFFCAQLPEVGSEFALPERESTHLFRVFRAVSGEQVKLLDGRGAEMTASVVRKGVLLAGELTQYPEPERKLHLFCAQPKRLKLDDLLKQAAELGVWTIQPVTLERSVAKGEPRERWEILLQEGCKQSKNPFLPQILPTATLDEALKKWQNCHCPGFYGAIGGGQPEIPGSDDLAWFVGPEGGFAPEEEAKLQQSGVQGLNLGPYVLRLETAAVAGLAVLRQFMLRCSIALLMLGVLGVLAGCGETDLERHPLMKKAEFYRTQGDPVLAQKFYRRLLEKYPRRPEIYLKLGSLSDEGLNDPLSAWFYYNQYLAMVPDNQNNELVEGYRLMARAKIREELTKESLPRPPQDAYDELVTANGRFRVEAQRLKAIIGQLQQKIQKLEQEKSAAQTAAVRNEPQRYTVKPGDFLGRIARKFRVSVSDLMRENGLNSARDLRPGQVLQIPERN